MHVLLARADPDRRGVPALGRPGSGGRRRVRRGAARGPARERRRRRGRASGRARPRRHPERRRGARRDRAAPRRRRAPGVRELREHDLGAGRRGVRAPGHAVLGDRRGGRDDRPRRRRAGVPRRALGRDPRSERDRVHRRRVRPGARRRPVEAPVRGHVRGRRVRARGGAGCARRARGARLRRRREVRVRPAGREHARVRPRPGRKQARRRVRLRVPARRDRDAARDGATGSGRARGDRDVLELLHAEVRLDARGGRGRAVRLGQAGLRRAERRGPHARRPGTARTRTGGVHRRASAAR